VIEACLGARGADLVAGRLTPAAAERAHMHLVGCASCRADVIAQRQVADLLSGAPAPRLDPDLYMRLVAIPVGARSAGMYPSGSAGLRPARSRRGAHPGAHSPAPSARQSSGPSSGHSTGHSSGHSGARWARQRPGTAGRRRAAAASVAGLAVAAALTGVAGASSALNGMVVAPSPILFSVESPRAAIPVAAGLRASDWQVGASSHFESTVYTFGSAPSIADRHLAARSYSTTAWSQRTDAALAPWPAPAR